MESSAAPFVASPSDGDCLLVAAETESARMSRHHHALVAVLAPLVLAAAARAQNVFVVAPSPGPGVFSTRIQDAVNAAADGDVVLVKSGSYPGFLAFGKSLTVVAEDGA